QTPQADMRTSNSSSRAIGAGTSTKRRGRSSTAAGVVNTQAFIALLLTSHEKSSNPVKPNFARQAFLNTALVLVRRLAGRRPSLRLCGSECIRIRFEHPGRQSQTNRLLRESRTTYEFQTEIRD